MFKNMFKRSWLSIKRKPSRSIILVVVLFVMANMLLATISIKNSVNSATQYAKEQIGGTVYLQPDTDALKKAQEAAKSSSDSTNNSTTDSSTTTSTTTAVKSATISEALAKNIAKSSYIKDYTYSVVTSANADGYTVVKNAQNEREQQFKGALDNAKNQAEDQVNQFNASRDTFNEEQQSNNSSSSSSGSSSSSNSNSSNATSERRSGSSNSSSSTRSAPPQFSFNFNLNFSDPSLSRGDTTIQGVNSFSFISDVENGSMKIVDGKAFDESTTDGVVISKELADANNLSVGSEIKFKTTDTAATELTFKIVGLYQTSTEDFNTNTVYMNIDSAKKFYTADQLSKLSVQNVRYYLTSAEDKDAFLAEAQKNNDLTSSYLKLDIDDSSYETMVGPIEQVGSFASTVFWIVAGATVAIITLIVAINIKDRRYEMGVLLSLGAKRMNIIGQVFVELVVVGTIGFALSLGTSHFIAQKIGDELLAKQVASSATTTSAEQRGANARPGRTIESSAKQIDTIDVSAGLIEYAMLFGIGYLILVVAMIFPSINILRYQPKTILTGKE